MAKPLDLTSAVFTYLIAFSSGGTEQMLSND